MSKKTKLVPFWHPVLHKRAQEVALQEEVDEIIEKMKTVLSESGGVGLAAPQIGFSKRIILIKEEEEIVVFINPEIIDKSKETVTIKEGCLSFSGVWCDIIRAKRIRVKAQDLQKEEIVFEAEGVLSVILQHEIDHLNGRLFIDDFDLITKIKLILKHVFRKEEEPE